MCTAEGCNAKIGGTNHVSSSKNKRIALDDAMFAGTPGYHTSVKTESDDKEALCLSDRIMRLLIHALTLASMELKYAPGSKRGNVVKMMSHANTNGFCADEVSALFSNDFVRVRKRTGYSEDDTSIGLHMMLSAFVKRTTATHSDFNYSHDMHSHLIR